MFSIRFPFRAVPSKISLFALLCAVLACPAMAADPAATGAANAGVVDIGSSVPDKKTISEGLFPEEFASAECKELILAGFKCMSFKPAVRFSIPGLTFSVGSAELSEQLKTQLAAFADVLRERKGSGKMIKIEGHADASGSPQANEELSKRRAQAVREFLVRAGADAKMLESAGYGAARLKNPENPTASENRRVELGRAAPN